MEMLGGWARQSLPVIAVMAVPAVLLWALLVIQRRDRGLTMRRTIREAGADVLLALTLGAILALTVLPGGEATRPATGRSLIPFEDLLRSLGPGMPHDALDLAIGNLVANAALFVPFGLALGLRFPAVRLLPRLAVCAGLSALVEWIQLTWSIGRSADITDVIMNTLGAAAGMVIARAVILVVRRHSSAST
jgi:glycopeptide antibiotics resistance protein